MNKFVRIDVNICFNFGSYIFSEHFYLIKLSGNIIYKLLPFLKLIFINMAFLFLTGKKNEYQNL